MIAELNGRALGFFQRLLLPHDMACSWTEPAVTDGEWELEACPRRVTQLITASIDGRERVRLYCCAEHIVGTLEDARVNLLAIAQREARR